MLMENTLLRFYQTMSKYILFFVYGYLEKELDGGVL